MPRENNEKFKFTAKDGATRTLTESTRDKIWSRPKTKSVNSNYSSVISHTTSYGAWRRPTETRTNNTSKKPDITVIGTQASLEKVKRKLKKEKEHNITHVWTPRLIEAWNEVQGEKCPFRHGSGVMHTILQTRFTGNRRRRRFVQPVANSGRLK